MFASTKTHAEKVWAGQNPGGETVEASRQAYLEMGIPRLLPYLSDLYSFRNDAANREEFLLRYMDLLAHAETLVSKAPHIIRGPGALLPLAKWPERVDMVTTYLAYYGKCPEFEQKARDHFVSLALRACTDALPELRKLRHTDQAHSYYLTLLTYVSLIEDVELADALLDECAAEAPEYLKRDRNQRARVFIKLGLLLRKQQYIPGHEASWPRGIYWGIRGGLVRGVSLNVRLKAAAALLGIER